MVNYAPRASPTFTGTATVNNLTVIGTCTGCGGGSGIGTQFVNAFGGSGYDYTTGHYITAGCSTASGGEPCQSSTISFQQIPSMAGTYSRLCTTLFSGPTGTDTVLKLNVNGSDSSTLVLTIPAGSPGSGALYCDTTHTQTVSAGDLVAIHVTSGGTASTPLTMSIEVH